MNEAPRHELDQAEFERVLAVLEREQRAMQPSRAQRFSYRLYTIFIWVLVLSLLAAICFALAREEGKPGKADYALDACLVAAAICYLGGIVSLLLNLPLIYKIFRQRVVIRRLGFSGASSALWRAHQETRRGGVVIGWVALGLGILFSLLSVAWFVLRIPIAGWIGLLIGTLFIMFYVLTNGKAWLDMMSARWTEVTQLKESMLNLRNSVGEAGAERIEVSSDVIKQFSSIEAEQIARSRVRAIAESASAPKAEFSILSSHDVLKMKAGLGTSDRLKVEGALDALMLQPRPPDAQPDAGTGLSRQRVKGTELELVYSVDDTARQLRVVTLRQAVVESATHD